jgi:hypothetical protein
MAVEAAGVAVVAAVKTMARVVAAADAAAEGNAETVPIRNPSKTATFLPNQDRACSNFTRTDTASFVVPRTITPANVAIRSFPER